MLVNEKDLIRAYNRFESKGYAGVSVLQRELKFPFWKAKLICDRLVFLKIIEGFDNSIITSNRTMRLQKVLMTEDNALETIKNA